MMTTTIPPRGRGNPPANAVIYAAHELWQYPVWQLDDNGWAVGYTIHSLQVTDSNYQVLQ